MILVAMFSLYVDGCLTVMKKPKQTIGRRGAETQRRGEKTKAEKSELIAIPLLFSAPLR